MFTPKTKVKDPMKIYVASSWRNNAQPDVVAALRIAGHNVYDFKNPPNRSGFSWSQIDPGWQGWKPEEYIKLLSDPIAENGFTSDWNAMVDADACVLVMPCGRSAHIEAGYFVGAGKPLIILLGENQEPELMYKMATSICVTTVEVVSQLSCYRTLMEGVQHLGRRSFIELFPEKV